MIIGLVGFKQIGKSTAATHLEIAHNFKRHNFKDALVAEIEEGFPELLQEMIDLEHKRNVIEGILDNGWDVRRLFAEKPPLMRALMQNFGTEVRRKQDKNYWVKQWANKAVVTKGNVVVDDVRFKNEAASVKGQGGIIIRLTRPDVITGGGHSSETEQLEIVADYTIDCEKGNLQKLYDDIDSIVNK